MRTKLSVAALCVAVLATASIGARADMDTQRSAAGAATDRARGDVHGTDSESARNAPHMSMGISKILKALFAAAGQKDWAAAKAKLAEARAVSSPTQVDLFEIDVVAAYVALNTSDYSSALVSYKKVIASPLFAAGQTPMEQTNTLKNAIILSNEAGDFTSAIAFGEKLIATGPLDDSEAVALATAYYGNKNYARAQSLAQQAIDAETAAGMKPNNTAVEIVAKGKQ